MSERDQLWRTLPGRLAVHAAERPDRVALREKRFGVWQEITWSQYYRAVSTVGRMLWGLGVRPGDHVAILSDNRTEWLYADLGAQGIGARSVGVYQTNPPSDVAWILSHSQSKVLFCEDQEQVDKAVEVADQTPAVEHVIVFDPRGTRRYPDPRLQSWEGFLARGEELLAAEPGWFRTRLDQLDPEAPSMVVYTSGTTGTPKGALLSSANATAVDGMNEVLGASEDDMVLSYLPLCHVAEKIFTLFLPLQSGAIAHFGESIATVQQDLREVSPTVFLGVPRIWEKMHANVTLRMQDSTLLKRTLFDRFSSRGRDIADPQRATAPGLGARAVWRAGDLSVFRPLQERLGLRRCRIPVSGAAPISSDLLRWFHGVGIPILEGYGQTECAGVSHCNWPGTPKLGSVGQPIPGMECITAEDGEVLVRGKAVFCGYLHDEEATRETIDDEGWLHTGDVGRIDEDGYLWITGRKKEILITAGGKNLSPEKIENALKMSPYLKEAVAVGDRRKFVSALVQIDRDAVGDWATREGLPYTDFADLTRRPAVLKLIDREVHKANQLLARVEQVRAFRLFPKELHQDDGELTATQKVRRRAVHDLWGGLIAEIYGEKPS
ncbi:MAG: AMP-binding protein [Deltaproteobacteria bacterium]|nr:AMP-binding protein [Deltaproteobacteria bacterium]